MHLLTVQIEGIAEATLRKSTLKGLPLATIGAEAEGVGAAAPRSDRPSHPWSDKRKPAMCTLMSETQMPYNERLCSLV
jgi:hypothetical protein